MPPPLNPVAIVETNKPTPADKSKSHPARRLDTGLFLAIVSLILMLVITLLQWNGVVTVPWKWSAFSYSVFIVISFAAFWRWEVACNWSRPKRWIGATLLVSVIAAASVAGVRSQYNREHPQVHITQGQQSKTAAPTPKGPPFTLEDLFGTDFPTLVKLKMDSDPMLFEDGQKVVVAMQEYADFSGKSSFMGYYVPPTPLTFRVCVRIANSVKINLSDAAKKTTFQAFDSDGDVTSLEKLTFSGRVFIYHMWPLDLKQKSVLADYFKTKQLDVEFRGIQYLQAATIAQKMKEQEDRLK